MYPEITMVGKNEDQLKEERVPYEVGVARFRETGRNRTGCNVPGLLKILFHRATRTLLGVHSLGETATECVHLGHRVLASGGTIDDIRDTVVDDATVAARFEVCVIDGLSKLGLSAFADRRVDLEREVVTDVHERPESMTWMAAV
jgi:NAD(P) transhydrogenase